MQQMKPFEYQVLHYCAGLPEPRADGSYQEASPEEAATMRELVARGVLRRVAIDSPAGRYHAYVRTPLGDAALRLGKVVVRE